MSDQPSEEIIKRVSMLAPVEDAVWSHIGHLVEHSTTEDAHTITEWVIHELLAHGFTITTPAGDELTSWYAESTDD